MQNNYSIEALSEFVQTESSELESLQMAPGQQSPSEFTLQTILGFSKQLSVRPSSTLGRYEQNLN